MNIAEKKYLMEVYNRCTLPSIIPEDKHHNKMMLMESSDKNVLIDMLYGYIDTAAIVGAIATICTYGAFSGVEAAIVALKTAIKSMVKSKATFKLVITVLIKSLNTLSELAKILFKAVYGKKFMDLANVAHDYTVIKDAVENKPQNQAFYNTFASLAKSRGMKNIDKIGYHIELPVSLGADGHTNWSEKLDNFGMVTADIFFYPAISTSRRCGSEYDSKLFQKMESVSDMMCKKMYEYTTQERGKTQKDINKETFSVIGDNLWNNIQFTTNQVAEGFKNLGIFMDDREKDRFVAIMKCLGTNVPQALMGTAATIISGVIDLIFGILTILNGGNFYSLFSIYSEESFYLTPGGIADVYKMINYYEGPAKARAEIRYLYRQVAVTYAQFFTTEYDNSKKECTPKFLGEMSRNNTDIFVQSMNNGLIPEGINLGFTVDSLLNKGETWEGMCVGEHLEDINLVSAVECSLHVPVVWEHKTYRTPSIVMSDLFIECLAMALVEGVVHRTINGGVVFDKAACIAMFGDAGLRSVVKVLQPAEQFWTGYNLKDIIDRTKKLILHYDRNAYVDGSLWEGYCYCFQQMIRKGLPTYWKILKKYQMDYLEGERNKNKEAWDNYYKEKDAYEKWYQEMLEKNTLEPAVCVAYASLENDLKGIEQGINDLYNIASSE